MTDMPMQMPVIAGNAVSVQLGTVAGVTQQSHSSGID
jgi:hypothetical protein